MDEGQTPPLTAGDQQFLEGGGGLDKQNSEVELTATLNAHRVQMDQAHEVLNKQRSELELENSLNAHRVQMDQAHEVLNKQRSELELENSLNAHKVQMDKAHEVLRTRVSPKLDQLRLETYEQGRDRRRKIVRKNSERLFLETDQKLLVLLGVESAEELNTLIHAVMKVQSVFRMHKARKTAHIKQCWKIMRTSAKPAMEKRLRELRHIYDHSNLIDNLDWTHNTDTFHTPNFKNQTLLMFFVPIVVVGLWICFPIAAHEDAYQDKHYGLFLVYWFFWLMSAVFFFFSMFELIVKLSFPEKTVLACMMSGVCVSVHAIVYAARGSTSFWDNCLDSSMFHFVITSIGLFQILFYIGWKIINEVKKAEKHIQKRQSAVIKDRYNAWNMDQPTDALGDVRGILSKTPSETESRILHHAEECLDVEKRHNSNKPNRKVSRRVSAAQRRGEELARKKAHKRRRHSMIAFDFEAKSRVKVASRVFVNKKMKQIFWTAITATWAATCFWVLSIFSAFFVTYAKGSNTNRLILTGVFHFLTKFFEVSGLVLAEEADVIALHTAAPGHLLSKVRKHNRYDNYALWRLSHRMAFCFIAFKRSFYISLFAEATDLTSFVAMGFGSLFATVITQFVLSSKRFHDFIIIYLERRSYPSMGCEFKLNNIIDGFTTVMYFTVFVVFFIIAKQTNNGNVYPYFAHSGKDWDVVFFLFLYAVFTVAGNFMFGKYLQKVIPNTDANVDLGILFKLQDRRLFLSIIIIGLHVGMDPYYSLAVTNMSHRLPCDADASAIVDPSGNTTTIVI
jgi:hypothetical protein